MTAQVRWGVAGVFLMAVTALASAQQPPETTGSPQKKPPEVQKPKPATTPAAPEKKAPPAGASEVRITVRRFDFTGNSLFTSDQLAPLVASYTGRPVTLLEIYEAADKVAEFYALHGYTLASVVPPAQRITEGIVTLQVIEGRIGRVSLENTHWYSTGQITPYLGEFQHGQIYRASDLDDGLQRVNRLPGLQAKAVLRPGDTFGTSDLVIDASEQPFTVAVIGDNHGRKNLGMYRTSLSFAVNNPFRLEDQLQGLYLHSDPVKQNRLNYGYLAYSLPVSHFWLPVGPRLSLAYSQADFTTTGIGPGTSVDGKNKYGRLGLDWPLTTTRETQDGFGIAVTRQLSNTDIAGVALPGSTNLTLLELSGNYTHNYASLAATQLVLTASSNFKSVDKAQCRPAPNDCNDEILRLELDAQHLQPIYGRFDTYLHVNGVYSPDPLPPGSVYSIGGPNSVRGYAAAEVRGDKGYLASFGVRQGFGVGPTQLYARAFVDDGYAAYASPAPAGAPAHETLTSAGVGGDLAWKISAFNLAAKLDCSWPFGSFKDDPLRDPSEKTSPRLFGSVSVSY